MNRAMRNDALSYLSWRRIVMMSLAISVGFHFVFMLAFFYGETLASEKASAKHHEQTLERARPDADALHIDKFEPPMPRNADGSQKDARPKKFRLDRVLLHMLFSFIMICTLFFFNRRMMSIAFHKLRNELFFIILGSLLISTTMSIFFCSLHSLLDNPTLNFSLRMPFVRDGLTRDYSITALVIMICYLLRALYNQKMIAVENEALRTENIRTHYEALKSQLDPHFLFNSMNTLQSLINVDKDKAEDYIQQLSSVLRYTLQNKEVVTLSDELDCVRDYCSMMQIRYGDNLKFDFQIDKKFDNYKVLPLSVQGLVENAIKHNIISAKQPLKVSIVTNDDNCLKVSNAIQPKIMDDGDSGIGLANLVERYRLQWDAVVEISDSGKVFEVSLPLIEN